MTQRPAWSQLPPIYVRSLKVWRTVRLASRPPSTMAHTVMFTAKNYFYPIGNTSAVVLTDTLTPEEPANLLLLGCGDPRNILFTVYNQTDDSECWEFGSFNRFTGQFLAERTLDFTCCDIDPAVLGKSESSYVEKTPC